MRLVAAACVAAAVVATVSSASAGGASTLPVHGGVVVQRVVTPTWVPTRPAAAARSGVAPGRPAVGTAHARVRRAGA